LTDAPWLRFIDRANGIAIIKVRQGLVAINNEEVWVVLSVNSLTSPKLLYHQDASQRKEE